LYKNALVIVTGDHGELFGERGFYAHNSLYDWNIRPLMIIKPPASAAWDVPDTVDTIDFFPTVTSLVKDDIPSQCEGTPLQDSTDRSRLRITERIRPDSYNIAAEKDGWKGIFTYESRYPKRQSDPDTKPKLTEWYRLEDVRADPECDESEPPGKIRREITDAAIGFRTSEAEVSAGESEFVAAGVESQLADLGYK
jgi:arylsulfatase A-like enzyme